MQLCYPLADLCFLEFLFESTGVRDADGSVAALRHLFEDYLRPAGQQTYEMGPHLQHLQDVWSYLFTLHLEDRFDVDILQRVVQRAHTDGHHTMARNWEGLYRDVFRAQGASGR